MCVGGGGGGCLVCENALLLVRVIARVCWWVCARVCDYVHKHKCAHTCTALPNKETSTGHHTGRPTFPSEPHRRRWDPPPIAAATAAAEALRRRAPPRPARRCLAHQWQPPYLRPLFVATKIKLGMIKSLTSCHSKHAMKTKRDKKKIIPGVVCEPPSIRRSRRAR